MKSVWTSPGYECLRAFTAYRRTERPYLNYAFLAYEMLLWHNNSGDDTLCVLIVGSREVSILRLYA
ncbi:MAG: hypothetical protein OXU36_24280 [Candidatus Poribacteria bacterium]|nr:hypothetical protein [Candidatus Poribacteria bacterium]